MSNYCTNCKWLDKDLLTKEDICRNAFPNRNLQRIHGNPTKLPPCINENWYEIKVKQEKKMTTEEMIKVMQGYVDGKDLQYRNKKTGMDWEDVTNPVWEWYDYEYRIKPEPKYRPLKPEELIELKGKWLKVKEGSLQAMVHEIKHNSVMVGTYNRNANELLNSWTYEDGTPVGKLEE